MRKTISFSSSTKIGRLVKEYVEKGKYKEFSTDFSQFVRDLIYEYCIKPHSQNTQAVQLTDDLKTVQAILSRNKAFLPAFQALLAATGSEEAVFVQPEPGALEKGINLAVASGPIKKEEPLEPVSRITEKITPVPADGQKSLSALENRRSRRVA